MPCVRAFCEFGPIVDRILDADRSLQKGCYLAKIDILQLVSYVAIGMLRTFGHRQETFSQNGMEQYTSLFKTTRTHTCKHKLCLSARLSVFCFYLYRFLSLSLSLFQCLLSLLFSSCNNRRKTN